MNFDLVGAKVDRQIGIVLEIIEEIFLDQIALVPAADDELIHAMRGVDLHYMPEDGLAANFNHRLGTQMRLLGNTGPEPPGKNNSFH